MFYEFERRAVAFLKRIESMAPCSSRQQAYDSLLAHWHAVESNYHDDQAYLDALLHTKMSLENNWHGLDGNPCYWQSPRVPQLRVYIHDDGAIVIQRLGGTREDRILFALNSAQPVFHSPKPESEGAAFASAVQYAAVPEASLSKM
ncbi:hypothetical protein [Pantoea sp. 18069]|uniref:hypothetical protein n=1 Tax=Pantoea sp. 18069 TaxID=2681415 RepID=UPI00135779C8|nr:hypothetical protein [Pantoea sp. 18069]